MKRLVVVGGGISGLAAAWSAQQRLEEAGSGAHAEVLLLERSPEVGGKARSLRREGWLVEAGPTGFLDNEPVLDRLVESAGLTKLPAREAAARRFVVRKGELREIHAHPLRFARSGILSPAGLLRAATEPLRRPRSPEDESVWDFARRRLGRQVADRLIAPMVLGVFAGDARRISLPAAFPRMAELEREHGSLVRALVRLKRARGNKAGGPSGPAGRLTSFADGLQSLPRELARRARFVVRTGTEVRSLEPSAGRTGWRLRLSGEGEPLAADAVVLAGEAWSTQSLLEGPAGPVARELATIPQPPVVVAALGFRAEQCKALPRGFGCLIARDEGLRSLGVLWDTHLFPGRSAPGTVLVRAMLGGATDPGIADVPDHDVLRLVESELAGLLAIEGAPIFSDVVRWSRAIPQYEVGHLQRVRTVERELAALAAARPGLHLAGNYLHGVAFGKAARAGHDAGAAAMRSILG